MSYPPRRDKIMAIDYERSLELGRVDREEKRFEAASLKFALICNNAPLEGKWDMVVRALMEQFIIFQRRFDETSEKGWLVFMYAYANMIINFTERFKLSSGFGAIGYLRLGDAYLRDKDYESALEVYRKAYSLLPQHRDAQHVEFLKQQLLAEAMTGHYESRREFATLLNLLAEQSEYADGVPLTDWHRLIIRSGVYINAARAFAASGDLVQAEEFFRLAQDDSVALAKLHGKPLRLDEVQRLESELFKSA